MLKTVCFIIFCREKLFLLKTILSYVWFVVDRDGIPAGSQEPAVPRDVHGSHPGAAADVRLPGRRHRLGCRAVQTAVPAGARNPQPDD